MAQRISPEAYLGVVENGNETGKEGSVNNYYYYSTSENNENVETNQQLLEIKYLMIGLGIGLALGIGIALLMKK